MKEKVIPFVVAVLGDYSGDTEKDLKELEDREFVEIDRENFNDVLKGMKPKLIFQVDNLISYELTNNIIDFLKEEERITDGIFTKLKEYNDQQGKPLYKTDKESFIKEIENIVGKEKFTDEVEKAIMDEVVTKLNIEQNIESMDDFDPESIATQNVILKALVDERQKLTEVNSAIYGNDKLSEFLDEIVENTNNRINEIDELITKQINHIIHHSKFQKLEASWRGLHYLVDKTETSEYLKIKVLNVNKKVLLDNLENAVDFEQSFLFKTLYTNEFDMFGRPPIGVLIGDYEFTHLTEDMNLLEEIAEVGAAAHCPFISAASPALFNLDSFTELGKTSNLEKIFESRDYVQWRNFRKSPHAKYVTLTLPHVLMRLPYGKSTKKVKAFNFEENVTGKDYKKYLWGNSAYILGSKLTNSFAKYNWCVAIRGPAGGGLVEGLPIHTLYSDEGMSEVNGPTEIAIPERREYEFVRLGFSALIHCHEIDNSAFFSVPTLKEPEKYNTDEATANDIISAQMQYMLLVSRFAHYLKSIERDNVGRLVTTSTLQNELDNWIAGYITSNENASAQLKAEKPLRSAQITVEEIKGLPGRFYAMVRLVPHFQLDEITFSLRLVG